ncbi:hypothetical protein A2662_00780 [Candidatus Giovannonibacteria bacterium RIFCSPHIGHO2_01_FULL_45_33]|uniref:Phospholipid/glycerol acyltransferase domain-containing protein n=1 Tax=Candidatus Giovannonibacteria bacterium RIFCSPLOWO2_01_FULL_45_34 TaxID=1798351 RepID=A0A1F5WXZ3_9BACT|nr:MAG: hypothetical protein A2662_00780 [Candidatus Giovannonibacteria bacterium RIFCSPHIGHO2_01_FULL_45_33]OGF69000.1 MAG: hypothetical protein A3C73_04750 [Candidatus Giovannonibacteria bacterium RIFCSPHIGHO2_02_FULL_44_11]OGF80512.1 MAG: hypothetical protein A2930_02675 [Candidatus Giovannonibacteria bacterium RIFCSPLOWO2_01_FULL_45_34]
MDNTESGYFRIQMRVKRISMRLAKIFFKTEVMGREHAELLSGPLIIISNHTSFIDHFLIGVALPFNLKLFPIRTMAKKEQMDRPLIGPCIKTLGGFVSKTKGKNLDELFLVPEEILKNGGVVLMYPEAFIFTDGKLHSTKSGAAELAIRTSATILPIGISGMGHFHMPDLAKQIFARRKIKITFGRPFSAEGYSDRKILKKRIEDEMHAVFEPDYK